MLRNVQQMEEAVWSSRGMKRVLSRLGGGGEGGRDCNKGDEKLGSDVEIN